MAGRALPVYLTDEQYEALKAAARRGDRPMTDLVRELVAEYVVGRAVPPTDLSDLAGCIHSSEPTDVSARRDEMLEAAFTDVR